MAARRNPRPYRGCGWQGCHAWNGRTAIEGRVDGSREAFPAGTVRPIPAANARRRIRRIGAYVFLSRWKAEIGTQLKRQCPGHPIFVRAPALRVIGRSEARNRVRQLVEGLRQRILRPVVVNDFVLQHHAPASPRGRSRPRPPPKPRPRLSEQAILPRSKIRLAHGEVSTGNSQRPRLPRRGLRPP